MIKVEENEKIRIDKYLSEKLDLSRSKIQKLIDNKKVIVNNKFVSANYKIKMGDLIEVNDDLNYEINIEKENIPLDIVYEDDDLLIVNKESGMVTHPAPGHYTKLLLMHFYINLIFLLLLIFVQVLFIDLIRILVA